MALKQVLEIIDLLDRPEISGSEIAAVFAARGLDGMEVEPVKTDLGSTTFLKLLISGTEGKSGGGDAPTMGIVGFLGGVGARPDAVGLVSDGDGAVTALSAGLKLADMYQLGDRLQGDVLVTTHVSPDAPVRPHDPVPFMSSPIGMEEMGDLVCDPRALRDGYRHAVEVFLEELRRHCAKNVVDYQTIRTSEHLDAALAYYLNHRIGMRRTIRT